MNNQAWIDLIRDIPDFPTPGVVFKDITPLIGSPGGFAAVVHDLATKVPADIDVVVGMEARGFIFGAPVALSLGTGFVPVRKPGKLPGEVITTEYELEYGTNSLSVHRDAIPDGSRVLIVDDVLATGGTIAATARLIKELGATLVAVAVVLELDFLKGRQFLSEQGIEDVIALTHG
ncbi:adenine phosphoribosyltransferase [Microlunatus endophyticus]|uniref:Adenine phosphoribosyltransferase n=1 Tax=Microlunatus endophyticus TaxID=1716077 RepID=A0A917S360_9ACTN|nr:adenine phosphoribosyltransferase [Microlunatus endophyticus]GGL53496.1 adenine phosphoribosyltransferase [Microlunatus endophyticus]